MTLKKYRPENQRWYNACSKRNCKQKYIRCKECGRPGHFAFWLDSSTYKDENGIANGGKITRYYHVNVFVAHAHFVVDKDKGRHVMCPSHTTWIPEDKTKVIRTINGRTLPDFVKDELDRFFGM